MLAFIIGVLASAYAWEQAADLSQFADIDCDIDRRGRSLSLEEFNSEYAAKRRPVIITHLAGRWPAARLWQPTSITAPGPLGDATVLSSRTTLRSHFTAMMEHRAVDAAHDNMWDPTFFDNNEDWIDHYSVERFFRDDMYDHSQEHAMEWRWMLLGPAQSGTHWHRDPYNISAWNAVVVGQKLWAFYPHDRVRVPGLCDGHEPDAMCGWTPYRWFRERLPTLEPAERPQLCVQKAGEIMYISGGAWHQVLNLGEPTMAVTQNFVSRHNLRRVLDGMTRFAGDAFPVLRRQTVELIRQWEAKRPELFSDADLQWAAAAEKAMSKTMTEKAEL